MLCTSKPGSYQNPYLKNGDIIRVGKGTVRAITEPLNELTAPALSIFAIDNLLN